VRPSTHEDAAAGAFLPAGPWTCRAPGLDAEALCAGGRAHAAYGGYVLALDDQDLTTLTRLRAGDDMQDFFDLLSERYSRLVE
jgi:hypothetical protein